MRKNKFNKSEEKILVDEQISIEDIATDGQLDLVEKMKISSSYRQDEKKDNEQKTNEIASLNEIESKNVELESFEQDENGSTNDSFDWIKKHQRSVTAWGVLLVVGIIGLFSIDQLLRPDNNQVKSVKLIAQYKKVDADMVKKTVHDFVGRNYFSFELSEVQNTILDIPWVRKVEVRREWPARIVVKIDEYDAKAKWNDGYLMDGNKNIFETPPNQVPENLVSLNGPDGQHGEIYDDFQRWQKIFQRRGYVIEAIHLSNRQTYEMTLRLSDTLFNDLNDIKPGEQNENQAVSEFLTDIDSPSADEISSKRIIINMGSKEYSDMRVERFINIVSEVVKDNLMAVEQVDLRYEQGFSVKWVNGEQPAKLIAHNE